MYKNKKIAEDCLNTDKMSVLTNLIYRFYAIPIKTLASYFVDIDRPLLKLIWRDKRPRITNMILEEKNKVGGLMLPDNNID